MMESIVDQSNEILVSYVPLDYLPPNLKDFIKKPIYHVRVEFYPEQPKQLLRFSLEKFIHLNYGNIHYAFDGISNMFTTSKIKEINNIIHLSYEEYGKFVEFMITTSVVNVIHMRKVENYFENELSGSPLGERFPAMNIIINSEKVSLRFTNIGRSFFSKPQIIPPDFNKIKKIWEEFFRTAKGWKPYSHVHKEILKPTPLIKYIKDELQCNLDLNSYDALETAIKGLRVVCSVPNQPETKRSYKIHGLLESASKYSFDEMIHSNFTKRTLTVVQYFKEKRNYDIKYPNLPCLNVGNINRSIAIPIELCTVKNEMKNYTGNQTAFTDKYTTQLVAQDNNVTNSNRNIENNQGLMLQERFGVVIKDDFTFIKPKNLNDSKCKNHNLQGNQPPPDIWQTCKLLKPVKVKRWMVLNMDKLVNINDIIRMENFLMTCKDVDVDLLPAMNICNMFIHKNTSLNDVKKLIIIFYKHKIKATDFFMIIVPNYSNRLFSFIKLFSNFQVKVQTQCIQSKTVFNMNYRIAKSILYKIKLNLTESNCIFGVKNCPSSMYGAIVFGATVTRPYSNQTSYPSVVAVAASHDFKGSQYNMEWRFQSTDIDIIQNLEDIIYKQLLKFIQKTKTLPKNIIYFRDGVCEPQFLQSLEYEFISIRRACLRLYMNYKPSLTILVVQNTQLEKMFALNSVVFNDIINDFTMDTQMTHPTELDFNLCSHFNIEGIFRPSSYHLIWDDSEFTIAQLNELSSYICYMFGRCIRSASYPAPLYYAHLGAFKARSYIEKNETINVPYLNNEQNNNKLELMFSINPMFFF